MMANSITWLAAISDGVKVKSVAVTDVAFDLSIYQGEEEVYRSRVLLYSLDDAAKIIRRELKLGRKSIAWEKSKTGGEG